MTLFTRRLVWTAAVALIALLGLDAAHAGVPHALKYTNPVFRRDFPDPMVVRLSRHDYFAYGTTPTWILGAFPILHSTDFVHWKHVGNAFKSAPLGAQDLWAPDVVKRGKTYYLYYVAKPATVHCIAVATGARPQGPFRHSRIISCADRNGYGFIDPDLFIDKNGKAYLYVSIDDPVHMIAVIPMKHDLTHAAVPSQALFGVSQAWEHGPDATTVEGPFLIHHGSLYYLFYSGNSYQTNYAMGYATSTSPTGPFTKYPGNPILKGNDRVQGPGGGSVVTGPDNQLWMVYHAWTGREGYSRGGVRNMRIDPLVWNGDIVTVPVHPSQ